MNNISSFLLNTNMDNSPMCTVAKNMNVLSENFKSYTECEKNKYLESSSLDNTINFTLPDEYLMDKIIQQVEFLFSDANISKDKFLLKHIRRNKEGYVSLKLISSLRKVKVLTKDWRVVAYSLQKSEKLQLNDEMTKIKRIETLPQTKILETSRSVLVFNYLPSCWSPDNLKKKLKILGSIVFLEIVNSKADVLYANVHKTLSFYEKIATLPFAVVMFETPNEAENAVLQTSHPSSVILKIVPLLEGVILKNTSAKDKKESVLKNSEFPTVARFDNKMAEFGYSTYSENRFCSRIRNYFPSVATEQCMLFDNNKNYYQPQKDMQSNWVKKEKMPLSSSYKGDRTVNNTGYQRKSFFRNHTEAQVVILRHPRGPDGTKGFWIRGAQNHSLRNSTCVLY